MGSWLCVLLLAACGGSDGGSGELEVVVNSAAGLDGYVTADGFRDTVMDIRVGDQDHMAPGRAVRGFVSFDMPALPVGVVIERANIRLYQQTVVGDPFDQLRTVIVDHVSYGTSLDPTDYAIASLDDDIGTASGGKLGDHAIPEVSALRVLDGGPESHKWHIGNGTRAACESKELPPVVLSSGAKCRKPLLGVTVADKGDRQPFHVAAVLANRKNVQQRLRGMLMGSVAGVDHGAVQVLAQQVRRAGRAMANDDGVHIHRFNVLGRIDKRFAFGEAAARRGKLDHVGAESAGGAAVRSRKATRMRRPACLTTISSGRRSVTGRP